MAEIDSREALLKRRARASKRDTVIGLLVLSTMEHIESVLGEEQRIRIREATIGPRKAVPFFHYPMYDLLTILDLFSKERGDHATAIEECGAAAVRAFFNAPAGKVMARLANQAPHDMIATCPAGYRACVTYGTRMYSKLGERHAQVKYIGELLGPAWQLGVFKEALTSGCGINGEFSVQEPMADNLNFIIDAQW